MKKVLLFISLFIFLTMNAQIPSYEWGKLIGNNMNIYVYDNAVDTNGNVYLTGEYSGTVDFDPGTGTFNQTATASGGRDIFILKLDASGAFSWVKTYGGTGIDFGSRISIDNNNNVYVGGRFQNTVTFTGFGSFSSNGGYDGFLLKIDALGTLEWVLDLSGGGTEGFLGITTDNLGNVYTTGFFNTASATLGGFNSTWTTLTRSGSSANYDFFVAKYNTNGEIIWSNKTGAGYDEIPYGITLTDDNKVVTAGTFVGTSVDFNPGAASTLLYSNSNSYSTGFIQVLNASDGTFSWARSLGSASNDGIYDVATANNNIYVTGYFSGTQADFNTTGSGGGDVINRVGAIDSFIAKYTSSSTFVWARPIRGIAGSGSDTRGTGLTVKGTPEKVYATGTFTAQVYLNPQAAANDYFISAGGKDAYVVSFNDTGVYNWGGTIRGSGNDDAWGISIDLNYSVFVSGYATGSSIDLDPTLGNDTASNSGSVGDDGYVVKLAQPNACIVNIPDANFKNYLVGDTNINTNGDTEIQCSEAAVFANTINCSGLNISDLTGIQAFTALTALICASNQLTNINLTQNTALITLNCGLNQLTSLDISQNVNLEVLSCYTNQLTSIDVSNNTALQGIYCHTNLLTNLDVSANVSLLELYCHTNSISALDVATNSNLQALYCYGNQITTLDFSQNNDLLYISCQNNQLNSLNLANGANAFISGLDASNNPNLTCIQIDNGFTPPTNGSWIKDITTSYSDNCAALNSTVFADASSFILYPNPVKDIITIQFDAEIENVELYNYSGQKMKIVVRDNRINMSNLASGLYILKAKTTTGIEVKKRIIKE